MELMTWWLPLVLIGCLLIGSISVWLIRKKHPKHHSTKKPIANSSRLTRLPGYQRAIRIQTHLTRLLIFLVGIALLVSLALSGRPAYTSVTESEVKNRDIILCLDVSGSMYEANKELTAIYAKLVKDFNGERLGMVIFDSSPVTLFPLTNDYDFISTRLEALSEAFGSQSEWLKGKRKFGKEDMDQYYELFYGVHSGSGSSLIGDGLASCVNRFDVTKEKRSRSIIFGTDNYLMGNPIVTLEEAAALAKERDIRVYGVNPADHSTSYSSTPQAEAFKKAALATNGDYYKMEQATAAQEIVQKITAQDATRFKGSPRIVVTDIPEWFLYVSLLLIASIFIVEWRMKI